MGKEKGGLFRDPKIGEQRRGRLLTPQEPEPLSPPGDMGVLGALAKGEPTHGPTPELRSFPHLRGPNRIHRNFRGTKQTRIA